MTSVTYPATVKRLRSGFAAKDASGDLTAMPMLTMSYDVENRLAGATHSLNGTDQYAYDPSNRRVWKNTPAKQRTYFYGVDGTRLGTYTGGSTGVFHGTSDNINVYFAGKLVWQERSDLAWAAGVVTDRLGSVVVHGSAQEYFPYGEEPSTTQQDRQTFATYCRDNTTALDYANQRYYGRTIGRFLTADPYMASGGPADPQSWNRYSYAHNDPVNYVDSSGQFKENPCRNGGCGLEPPPYFKGYLSTIADFENRPGVKRREHAEEIANAWEMLSDECKKGLRVAMAGSDFNTANLEARLNALGRAEAQMDILVHAAGSHGIDWPMLAAIAIRESKFNPSAIERLKDGSIDGGRGAFQIDININTGVSEANAMNLTWAADWAAHSLAHNYAFLATKFPNFDASHLLQATAATYNLGTKNISGNPDTIDKGSTGGNYGSNILNLMDCFH